MQIEARRLLIKELIQSHPIATQSELVEALQRRGEIVTQTTISRDLSAIGATKRRGPDGEQHYTLPAAGRRTGDLSEREDLLRERLFQFLTSIDHSGPLVVLKTPPGSAGPVAAALDAVSWPEVLGTISGDDTIFVTVGRESGAEELVDRIQRLIEAT